MKCCKIWNWFSTMTISLNETMFTTNFSILISSWKTTKFSSFFCSLHQYNCSFRIFQLRFVVSFWTQFYSSITKKCYRFFHIYQKLLHVCTTNTNYEFKISNIESNSFIKIKLLEIEFIHKKEKRNISIISKMLRTYLKFRLKIYFINENFYEN